ncbi:hypothetical protein CARUB_v10008881mg, partial [Capsella rubella]
HDSELSSQSPIFDTVQKPSALIDDPVTSPQDIIADQSPRHTVLPYTKLLQEIMSTSMVTPTQREEQNIFDKEDFVGSAVCNLIADPPSESNKDNNNVTDGGVANVIQEQDVGALVPENGDKPIKGPNVIQEQDVGALDIDLGTSTNQIHQTEMDGNEPNKDHDGCLNSDALESYSHSTHLDSDKTDDDTPVHRPRPKIVFEGAREGSQETNGDEPDGGSSTSDSEALEETDSTGGNRVELEVSDSSPARPREKGILSEAEVKLIDVILNMPQRSPTQHTNLLPIVEKDVLTLFKKTLKGSPHMEHLTKCGFLLSNKFLLQLIKPTNWVDTFVFFSHPFFWLFTSAYTSTHP